MNPILVLWVVLAFLAPGIAVTLAARTLLRTWTIVEDDRP